MLFETNTNGHKHPSIRLFIIKQDTIGKPKKTKSGIQPRTPPPPPTPTPHPHPPPPPQKKNNKKKQEKNTPVL